MRVSIWAVLSLSVVAAGCTRQPLASFQNQTSAEICKDLPTATLDDVWLKYFQGAPTSGKGGCAQSACHLDGDAAGLLFSTPAELVAATVGVPAHTNPGFLRIAPGDPARSYLYQRLWSGPAGRQMPVGGPYLDDEGLRTVAGWICAGAPSQTELDAGVPGDLATGPPVLVSFSPTTAGVGDTITVTGYNLVDSTGAAMISVGSVAATLGAGATRDTLSFTVPAGASTAPIHIQTAAGSGASVSPLTIVATPVLTTVTPTSVTAGISSQTLTLTGSSFLSTSQTFLVLGTTSLPLATTYGSATSLTATVSSAQLADGASYSVVVSNAPPSAARSMPQPFTVNNPAPTLTTISPSTAPVAGPSFTLSLTGTGFVPSSVVGWQAGVSAKVSLVTHFGSSTTLTADVPSTMLTTAASVSITVTNPTPGGGTTTAQTLTIAACSGTPILTGIMPTLAANNVSFTLVATGGCFDCNTTGAQITLDGVAQTTTLGTCAGGVTSQLGSVQTNLSSKTYSVGVKNPNASTSSTLPLSIIAPRPLPVLSTLTPSAIGAGSAGFTLAATGTSFDPSSVLYWNGAPRTTTVSSATALSADIGPTDVASAGTVQVTIYTPAPGGGTSNAVAFSIVPVPTLTGTTPTSATVGAAPPMVQLTGTNFVSGAVASFNGSARTTSFVSSTSLTMTLTSGDVAALGTYPIVVTNPGGIASNAVSFAVTYAQPKITSLSASTTSTCGVVAAASPFSLTITGSNFGAGATVTVSNGTTSYPVTVGTITATSIVASVTIASPPAGNYASVVVTNTAPSTPSAPAILGVASASTNITNVYNNTLKGSCGGTMCHNGNGTQLPGSMDLSTAAASKTALVNVQSLKCAGTVRVLPCDPRPRSSFLIDKVTATAASQLCGGSGTAGDPMPKTGGITAAQIQEMINWVALGAP